MWPSAEEARWLEIQIDKSVEAEVLARTKKIEEVIEKIEKKAYHRRFVVKRPSNFTVVRAAKIKDMLSKARKPTQRVYLQSSDMYEEEPQRVRPGGLSHIVFNPAYMPVPVLVALNRDGMEAAEQRGVYDMPTFGPAPLRERIASTFHGVMPNQRGFKYIEARVWVPMVRKEMKTPEWRALQRKKRKAIRLLAYADRNRAARARRAHEKKVAQVQADGEEMLYRLYAEWDWLNPIYGPAFDNAMKRSRDPILGERYRVLLKDMAMARFKGYKYAWRREDAETFSNLTMDESLLIAKVAEGETRFIAGATTQPTAQFDPDEVEDMVEENAKLRELLKVQTAAMTKAVREMQRKQARPPAPTTVVAGKRRAFRIGIPLVHHVSKGLEGQIEEMTAKVDVVTAEFSKMTNVASTGVNNVSGFFKKLAITLPICMTVWYLLHYGKSKVVKAVLLSAIAIVAGVTGERLWDNIKRFFDKKPEEVEAHGPPMDGNEAGELVSTVLTFLAFDGKSTFCSPAEIQKRMASKDRSTGGWSSFISFVGRMVEKWINAVRAMFGKENVDFMKSGINVVDKWCERCAEFMVPFSTGKTEVVADDGDKVQGLIAEGEALSLTYRLTPAVVRVVERRLAALTRFQVENKAAFSSFRGKRPETACVAFRGTAGIGKTVLLDAFIQRTLAKVIPKEEREKMDNDFTDEIYSHGSGEYWEGFRNQKVLVIDDWLQSNVVAGSTENDAMTLIRAVNGWPWPLNMAFGGKGCTFFRSPLCCLTTNATNLAHAKPAVHSLDALVRRIHYPYTIELLDDWALPDETEGATAGARRLDYQKWHQHCRTEGKISFEPWRLARHDFHTGHSNKVASTWIRVEELSDTVARDLKKRGNITDDLKDWTKSMVTSIEAQGPLSFLRRKKVVLPGGVNVVGPMGATISYPIKRVVYGGVFSETAVGARLHAELHKWTGTWSWLFENAVYALLAGAVVAAFAMAAKTLFKAFGHKEDKTNMTMEERVAHQLEKVDPVVALAALKFARYLRPDDITEAFKITPQALREVARTLGDVTHEREAAGVQQVRWRAGASAESGPKDRVKRAYTKKGAAHRDLAARKNTAPEAAKYSTGVYGQAGEGPTPPPVIEANCTIQATWDTRALVRRNSFRLSVVEGKVHTSIGVIILLVGNVALVPGHFTSAFHRLVKLGTCTYDSEIEMVNAESVNLTVRGMKVSDFVKLETVKCDEDLVLMKMPVHVPAGKDIVSKLMTRRDYQALNRVRLMVDPMRLDPVTNLVDNLAVVLPATHVENLCYKVDGEDAYAKRTYCYEKSPTRNGDCGAPLFLSDTPGVMSRTFAGVHIAGCKDTETGYCIVPTQETVSELLTHFVQKPIVQCESYPPHKEEAPVLEGYGSIMPICEVEQPLHANSTSKLRHTAVFNKWGPCNEEPARLRPFIRRLKDGTSISVDPMVKAVSRYGGGITFIDPLSLRRAVHTAFRRQHECSRDHNRKLLTFEEAVGGCPYIANANAVTMGTSPGYPWNIEGHTDKRKIFGDGQEPDFTTPYAVKLRAQVEEALAQARQGVRWLHVYSDMLKDETLSIAKVTEGKTRLISAAPLLYTVLWRMYFMAFTASVQNCRIRNGVGLGINPYKEWKELKEHLHSISNLCVAGDYTGFDREELPQVHTEICDEINRWYDDSSENQLVRRVLYAEVYNSVHLSGPGNSRKVLTKWSRSMPSGHPATTVLNSFYNLTILVLVYQAAVQYPLDFWGNVAPCVYGDDNIMSVSSEVAPMYNQLTMEALAPMFGMVYTPESKGEASVVETRPITDITFLKRSFRMDAGRVLAPLELNSILYSMYWTRDVTREFDIMAENLEITMEELSLHNDETWKQWVPLVTKAAAALEFPLVPKLPVEVREFYTDRVSKTDYHW